MMRPGSPASCKLAGSRRCASRASTATLSGLCWQVGRCWSRSSAISRTRSPACSENLGLVIGRAKLNVFAVRAEELIEGRPELMAAIRPLLDARNAIVQQVDDLDRKVMQLAGNDAQVRRFMTAPGAWSSHSSLLPCDVSMTPLGSRDREASEPMSDLTTRRYASGEVPIGRAEYLNRAIRCCEVTSMRQPMSFSPA